MDLETTIIEKEISLLTFEVRHNDERLKSLLSEEFLEIGASGHYFGLKEVLTDLPTEENWSCHTQNFEFRTLSKSVAQLIFKAFIKHNATDQGMYSRRTSLWRKEGGLWKMIYHQGTEIEPFDLIP